MTREAHLQCSTVLRRAPGGEVRHSLADQKEYKEERKRIPQWMEEEKRMSRGREEDC